MNVRQVLHATVFTVVVSGSAFAQARKPTEVILHVFSGPDGAHPLGGVILRNNVVYGTAYSGGGNNGTVFTIDNGQFTVIHNFKKAEGRFPQAGLTLAANDVFYGTLSAGGIKGPAAAGNGSVFSMTPDGKVTVLHQFQGPEGSEPVAPVTVDAAGNLIGTTRGGGASTYSGVLYKVVPGGATTALQDFSTTPCQGGLAPVTIQPNGDIFGTTWMNKERPAGCVWRYSAQNKFSILHNFDNGRGGREPRGGVSIDAQGNFYGANYFRGNSNGGTLFKLAPNGTETVLHSFACKDDGGYPYGSVLLTPGGVLYGTAASCGTGGGGVVYRYDTVKGQYSVLHSFVAASSTDGFLPIGPLAMDAAGNLYGATEYGGGDNLGIVFEIKP